MEQVQQQQLALLARKALLQDELKQIENSLGQLAAVSQYIAANPPAVAPETPSED